MRIWPTKRYWKRLAIGAAIIVALALIANGFMTWQTERRLQAKIAAIRAAGDPASIADLAPEPIPDEENAAAYLKRLKPQLNAFSKDYARFYNSPLGKAYEEADERGEPATDEQIAAVRAIVDKYPDLDTGITAAAQCERYASVLDYTADRSNFMDELLKYATDRQTARRFLQWRTNILILDGRNKEGVERAIQLLRLARLSESEPTLLAFLVTAGLQGNAAETVYDALAAGPITSKQHATLDQELSRQDDPKRLVYAIVTERALCASWFDLPPNQPHRLWVSMIDWPMKSYLIGALEGSDDGLKLVGRPWHEVLAELKSTDSQQGLGYGMLAKQHVGAAYRCHARSLAMLRSVRIFNALRQFAEKNGHAASGLEELNLPAAATIDPYSGEPLKLEHTADGWVIYSVMENGVDDGGDFRQLKDYGVAPPKRRLME